MAPHGGSLQGRAGLGTLTRSYAETRVARGRQAERGRFPRLLFQPLGSPQQAPMLTAEAQWRRGSSVVDSRIE